MPTRGRLIGLAASTLLAVAVLAGAPTAQADQGRLLIDLPGDGHGFMHDSGTPVIQAFRLAPGYSATGTLAVRNDAGEDAELRVQTFDVRQSENGCVGPESDDGDDTCSAAEGELLKWLDVTVSRSTGDGDQALWNGPLADLADGAVVLDRISPHEEVPLRFTVKMLRDAGNDTMTDGVRFDLRWTAQGEMTESDAEVLGAEAFAPGAGPAGAELAGASGGLPLVGTAIPAWLALADLAVLLCGLGLVTVAARQQRAARVPAPAPPAADED